MDRFILTDAQWETIEPHCLRPGDRSSGRTGGDRQLGLEAVLWIARTSSPWRDLPAESGPWNTVFKRFRHWVKADVFKRIFDAVSDNTTSKMPMVNHDVKVHPARPGAKGGLKARP